MITIIGGGLAGCEAAWQAAALDVPVVIHEMRPVRPTAVHKTDGLAELVCSNSFRGDKLDNAVGLLKEEMRRLGSLIMRAADLSRVPAGAALAVDRVRFSADRHARDREPPAASASFARKSPAFRASLDGPVIVATGPLTSDRSLAGRGRARRRRPPLFLRRDQPDRPRRVHRHVESVPRLPLGPEPSGTPSLGCPRGHPTGTVPGDSPCLRRRRWRGRLPELSDGQGRVRRISHRGDGGREDGVARIRRREVLRGVPADRGDGAPRRRHAAVRADEAGRPDRSAHRARAVRVRPAPAGQPCGRPLQPRRLPDADEVGRAGARAAAHSRTRECRVRAVRDDPPQHVHQRARRAARHVADAGPATTCSSPARSPASRATSSRRRRA